MKARCRNNAGQRRSRNVRILLIIAVPIIAIGLGSLWTTPVLLVLFAAAAVLVVRDVRTASLWLASHNDQSPPPSPADDSAR